MCNQYKCGMFCNIPHLLERGEKSFRHAQPPAFLSRGLRFRFGYALGCALWYTSFSFWLTSRE